MCDTNIYMSIYIIAYLHLYELFLSDIEKINDNDDIQSF